LFPAALDAAMQNQGVNQVQLSRLTDIAISRVNNYLKGHYRTIRPDHVAAICGALGTPAETAALSQAYLYDLLPDSCKGLVDIRVQGSRETGKWDVPTKGLPADFAAKYRDLYALCVSQPKVLRRTSEWIALMRETKG
jgi:transcriptional regulator with XRE-family HTH domain